MRYLWMALALAAAPAQADDTLTYSTGTGFFVSRDGYILTNHHVIEHCASIAIYGAVALTSARLVASDKEYDLALLKSDHTPRDIARLNSEKQPLRAGDPVVIVGYPGQSWQTGRTQTSEARIIATKGPSGEEKWLEISDALRAGNSGGPLLDASGNVAGVVAAKAQLVAYEETVQRFDIAISLPVIRRFLDAHSVKFEEADSGIYESAGRITEDAQRFVVNVRCRYVAPN